MAQVIASPPLGMTAGFAVVLAGQPPHLSGLGVYRPSLLCPGNRVSECRAKVQQLVPIPGRPQLGRTSTTPASSPRAHTVSPGAWEQLNHSPPSRPWGGSCDLTVPLGLKNEHTHTRHTQGSETRSIKSSPRKTWGNCVTLWFKGGEPPLHLALCPNKFIPHLSFWPHHHGRQVLWAMSPHPRTGPSSGPHTVPPTGPLPP